MHLSPFSSRSSSFSLSNDAEGLVECSVTKKSEVVDLVDDDIDIVELTEAQVETLQRYQEQNYQLLFEGNKVILRGKKRKLPDLEMESHSEV